MNLRADLRSRGEALAAPLPGLLARADHLAASVIAGAHGRRRPGVGDAFWQYRPAQAHEQARIDWRRSAKSDQTFVQEKEWHTAQAVALWVDGGAAMRYRSRRAAQDKWQRATDLAMALAILLIRGGERVGVLDSAAPRRGLAHLAAVARGLTAPAAGAPALAGLPPGGMAVLFSDFLGDLGPLAAALSQARSARLGGVLVQVMDPDEQDFPFKGRTLFEDMRASGQLDTQNAASLRAPYLARLGQRQATLHQMARAAGWSLVIHTTDTPASAALAALWQRIAGRF